MNETNVKEEVVSNEIENEKVTKEDKKCSKKVKSLELEIEKLTNEKKELSDKVLRLTAEMQNMNRRFSDEKANIYKYDGEKLVKEILPVIDNFERAITYDDTNLQDDFSKFLAGFKMIYTSLLGTLDAIGVSVIEAEGKEFDPNMMEAIMTENNPEFEQGIVLEVMRKGYIYNGKVMRVAMVKVNE